MIVNPLTESRSLSIQSYGEADKVFVELFFYP